MTFFLIVFGDTPPPMGRRQRSRLETVSVGAFGMGSDMHGFTRMLFLHRPSRSADSLSTRVKASLCFSGWQPEKNVSPGVLLEALSGGGRVGHRGVHGEAGPVGGGSRKGAAPRGPFLGHRVGMCVLTAGVCGSAWPWACCSLGLSPTPCSLPSCPQAQQGLSTWCLTAQRAHTQRQETRCPSGLRSGSALPSQGTAPARTQQ